MAILKGDLVSINSTSIRKVVTKVDKDAIPYFLVVYNNRDLEIFSVREPFVEGVNCVTDAKLCQDISDFFF